MTARTISRSTTPASLTFTRWLQIGLQASLLSVLAVLLTQNLILARWPELAAFKPLDSFARSALFTFVPAMGATAVFAWLVKKRERPEGKFLWISAVVLLLSFIPDYLLPIPNRTIPASTAAVSLHLVAGIVTVFLILAGYRRATKTGKVK